MLIAQLTQHDGSVILIHNNSLLRGIPLASVRLPTAAVNLADGDKAFASCEHRLSISSNQFPKSYLETNRPFSLASHTRFLQVDSSKDETSLVFRDKFLAKSSSSVVDSCRCKAYATKNRTMNQRIIARLTQEASIAVKVAINWPSGTVVILYFAQTANLTKPEISCRVTEFLSGHNIEQNLQTILSK